MSLADDLLSEICADETERLPFTIGANTVYVNEVSPREMELWRQDMAKARGYAVDTVGEWDVDGKVRLIIRCVTDEHGKRIWGPEHVERLSNTGRNRFIAPLYELCCHVNGIGETAESILKKNSAPARPSNSQSASAVTCQAASTSLVA